jgi:hypothetical protein
MVVNATAISIDENAVRGVLEKLLVLGLGYFWARCNPYVRSLPPWWCKVGWDDFLFFDRGASALVKTSVNEL